MKIFFKKLFKRNKKNVLMNDLVIDVKKFVNKDNEDNKNIEKICSWLSDSYHFDYGHVLGLKKELRSQACLDYLMIGITSGEINENALNIFLKDLKK